MTSRNSRRQPTACAYFSKVAIEGECFPRPDSRRATADWVVPMRSATSACVTPAAARALRNSSRNRNSSSSPSYSAFTSALSSARALSSLCVSIFVLLHSSLCCFKLSWWSFVRLLYKLVQHHNFSTNHRTVEYSSYPLSRLQSQFKKAVSHCSSMWHTKIWTKNFHPVRIT